MTTGPEAAPMREDVTRVLVEKLRELAALEDSNIKRCSHQIRTWSAEAADMIDRLAHTARPDAPWHTDLGSLQEAQRITRAAYRTIETERDRNTHIPGNPYEVALSALNSPLAALDQLINDTARPDAGDEVERVAEGDQVVAWLAEWSGQRPSDGLIQRKGLSDRDQRMMQAALGAAATTIKRRLAAMREGVDRGMVEEADVDWRKAAKLAGDYGIRFRTNAALVQFLNAIPAALSRKEGSS